MYDMDEVMTWVGLCGLICCSTLMGCAELPPQITLNDAGVSDAQSPSMLPFDAALESLDARRLRDGYAPPYDMGSSDVGTPRPRDLGIGVSDMSIDPIDAANAFDSGPFNMPEPVEFEYLDTVVELTVPDDRVWAHLIYVNEEGSASPLTHTGYGASSDAQDFWPASTIKMFAATAALEILSRDGFSIDATATFARETGGEWVEDVTMSFREIVHQTFNCSSNETYTLLLRFVGLDALNEDFFTVANGFGMTALMRGYVAADARPWAFVQSEAQRIMIEEAGRSVLREHQWSGRSYADAVGCTVYNESGTANCTTPREMAEHLRRLIMHDDLDDDTRFSLSPELLSWYRGDQEEQVLNNANNTGCGGPAFAGVLSVFPDADYYHKTGFVRQYRSSIHHVHDPQSGVQYTAALVLDNTEARWMRALAEEMARMVRTPGVYVHLDYLRDHVNPVQADVVVISDEPGTLELWVKPFADDPMDENGWRPLAGTRVDIERGDTAHRLRSRCRSRSEQVHIRGRVRTNSGRIAWSDIHYVIIDHTQACSDE